MYARALISLLTVWLSLPVHSQETEPTPLLKPFQFMCMGPRHLEALLDRKYKRSEDALRDPRVFQGMCMPISSYERVFRPREVQGARHKYLCYQRWDITRPEPPRENEQEFCSAFGAITTTRELFETRSGNFSIEEHEQYKDYESVHANCHEGGRVRVKRNGTDWERVSYLPIDSPRRGFGEPVIVKGDLNEVVRDGCRAKDYL